MESTCHFQTVQEAPDIRLPALTIHRLSFSWAFQHRPRVLEARLIVGDD